MIYGLPYKGSKSKLAERLVGLFPKAEHFYEKRCEVLGNIHDNPELLNGGDNDDTGTEREETDS